jgi:[calcium/calmodulin-dependent protein kinase] kinase
MEYFDKWEQFRNLLLVKTVPLIQILPRKERSHILQSLVVREYRDGEYIIRQGEKGEEFFIIQDGAVKVVQQRPSAEKDGPPTEVTLVTLREGHFFGEMSLVSDEPRVASVVSVRNAICFVLSKQAFQSALADESFRQAFNDVLVKRKEIRKQRAEKEHESNDASSSGGLSSSTGSFVTDGSTPKGSLSPQSSLRRFSSRSRQSSHNSSTNNSEVNITTTLSTKKLESGSRVINKYIVERELGKGSFGDVYLCTDQDSNIQYAMKTINRPPSSSWNDEATNAIRQEIAVMKRLKHQNIVFLHEVIDDQNSRKIYLIQEFMEGGALMPDAESCDPMDVKRARKYFRDILRGVCYLHSEGIIHRDIKPQNMLLSGAGVVKIADFGAAVFTGGSVQEKVAFGGTPAFMAPELFLTNTSIDFTKHPGIDVFALGATLYYMVIGRPPWMAKNQIDLAMKIKNIELTFPVEGIDPHLKVSIACVTSLWPMNNSFV